MNGRIYALCLIAATAFAAPALAQRSGDPNLGHFYMARQQIQITDDAPMVDDRRTNPAAAQQGQGALPNRPVALPKAGYQPYSQSMMTSGPRQLPKVVNGVPPKAPPPQIIEAQRGKAMSAMKLKKGPKIVPPTTAASYQPYKGYGGSGSVAQSTYGAGGGLNSSTAVQGSLMNSAPKNSALHWNRSRQR